MFNPVFRDVSTHVHDETLEQKAEKHELTPRLISHHFEIASLTLNGALSQAGLRVGDQILEIGNIALDIISFLDELQKNKDQVLTVKFRRDGECQNVLVQPKWNEAAQLFLLGCGYQDQQFFVRQVEGKDICTTRRLLPLFDRNSQIVVYADIEIADDPNERKLYAYKLVSAQGSERAPYDILSRFNRFNADIFVRNVRSEKSTGNYNYKKNRIEINPGLPEEVFLSVLLHEISHSFQRHEVLDPAWEELSGKYFFLKDKKFHHPTTIASDIRSIAKIIPDFFDSKGEIEELALHIIKMPKLHEVEIRINEYEIGKIFREIQNIDHYSSAATASNYVLSEEVSVAAQARRKLLAEEKAKLVKNNKHYEEEQANHILEQKTRGGISVGEILSLPRWLYEIDAEIGALLALRQIKRESEIDIFTVATPVGFKLDVPDSDQQDIFELARGEYFGTGKNPIHIGMSVNSHLKSLGISSKVLHKFPFSTLLKSAPCGRFRAAGNDVRYAPKGPDKNSSPCFV